MGRPGRPGRPGPFAQARTARWRPDGGLPTAARAASTDVSRPRCSSTRSSASSAWATACLKASSIRCASAGSITSWDPVMHTTSRFLAASAILRACRTSGSRSIASPRSQTKASPALSTGNHLPFNGKLTTVTVDSSNFQRCYLSHGSHRDAELSEVRHEGLVPFPAVGELHRNAEVHRLGRRVRVKQLENAPARATATHACCSTETLPLIRYRRGYPASRCRSPRTPAAGLAREELLGVGELPSAPGPRPPCASGVRVRVHGRLARRPPA